MRPVRAGARHDARRGLLSRALVLPAVPGEREAALNYHMAGGTTTQFVPANDEPWPNSITQRGIVAFVADRGYLDGYDMNQRIARQLVKQLEETCEAIQAVNADDVNLHLFIQQAHILGKWARAVFDVPSLFDGVMVDVPLLIEELPDMVVPLAVLSDAVGISDMMAAGLDKAAADVARGVRNGNQDQRP